jgi:hypothetical protein
MVSAVITDAHPAVLEFVDWLHQNWTENRPSDGRVTQALFNTWQRKARMMGLKLHDDGSVSVERH